MDVEYQWHVQSEFEHTINNNALNYHLMELVSGAIKFYEHLNGIESGRSYIGLPLHDFR